MQNANKLQALSHWSTQVVRPYPITQPEIPIVFMELSGKTNCTRYSVGAIPSFIGLLMANSNGMEITPIWA